MGFIGTKKGVIHWIFLHYHGGKVDKSGADAGMGYNYVIFGGDVNSLVYDAYKRIDEFNALGLNK